MPVATEYIALGDLIFLEEDDKYVGASGIGTSEDVDSCRSHEASQLRTSGMFSSRCVFAVQPQGTWTNLQNFKMTLERQGLTLAEGVVNQETRGAYRDCQRERDRNEKDAKRQAGRDLRFGMVIQLQHFASSKNLSTSRQPAAGRVGNRAIVDEHAGESGWFRVKPRLRVHNEGEKVHSGDPVVLEEVGTGQRLIFGGTQADGSMEVSAATDLTLGTAPAGSVTSTSFKMCLYRPARDEGIRDLLRPGVSCTLFHTETDGFLARRSTTSTIVDTVPGSPASSCAIWQILWDSDENGSACRWEGRFRIRHVASGSFLCVTAKGSDSVKRLGVSSPAPPDASDYQIKLVGGGQADESDLVFRFEPQYPMTGQITTRDFLRIVWETEDGQPIYLHGNNETKPSAGASPAAAAESTAESMGVDEAAGHVPLILSTDEEESASSVFAVRPVDHGRFADLTYVINSMEPFKAFLKARAQLPPSPKRMQNAASPIPEVVTLDSGAPADALRGFADAPASVVPSLGGIPDGKSHLLPMRDLTKTVIELIKFVTKSDNLDPFTREGMPIEQRQLILSEQGILGLAIECVDAPFRAGMYTYDEVRDPPQTDLHITHGRTLTLAVELCQAVTGLFSYRAETHASCAPMRSFRVV